MQLVSKEVYNCANDNDADTEENYPLAEIILHTRNWKKRDKRLEIEEIEEIEKAGVKN